MTRSKTILLTGAIVAALLALATITVYALEAEKEVRILCGLFTPGTSEQEVNRILATANLLHYEKTSQQDQSVIEIGSRFNFEMTHCSVEIIGSEVSNSHYIP